MEFIHLIPTPKVDFVLLRTGQDRSEGLEGTLCLTGHHLIFSTRREDIPELLLLHRCIDSVVQKPTIANNVPQGGTLIIRYKDLRVISIVIQTESEFKDVTKSLENLSRIEDYSLYYPFYYRPLYNILEDGWTMYRPEEEFAKLLSGDSSEWRLSNLNSEYSVCPTYSAHLVVPRHISDEDVISSAVFRDGGRFPIISYRHEARGSYMLRSSQQTTAPNMRRCRADEAILNTVLGKSKKGFIVDTWGKSKSIPESDQNYSQWKKIVRPIASHLSSASCFLDSFTKMVEACNDVNVSVDKFIARLDNSNWLGLVLGALNVACLVAQCLHQDGCPVLVHGGKGLDTTLIVTSLVQVILNPDCRTVVGLQALIEREWLQAGFPFHSRHRQSCYTPASSRLKSSGSSFALFLDCVFQITCQFPLSFEFNNDYLVLLFEHSYFSQFGTFLGDSEKERALARVQKKTTSLWSYINRPEVLTTLLNPLYNPNERVLWPTVAPISMVLWKQLYLRFVLDLKCNNEASQLSVQLTTQEKELRSTATRLRKQLEDLMEQYRAVAKL